MHTQSGGSRRRPDAPHRSRARTVARGGAHTSHVARPKCGHLAPGLLDLVSSFLHPSPLLQSHGGRVGALRPRPGRFGEAPLAAPLAPVRHRLQIDRVRWVKRWWGLQWAWSLQRQRGLQRRSQRRRRWGWWHLGRLRAKCWPKGRFPKRRSRSRSLQDEAERAPAAGELLDHLLRGKAGPLHAADQEQEEATPHAEGLRRTAGHHPAHLRRTRAAGAGLGDDAQGGRPRLQDHLQAKLLPGMAGHSHADKSAEVSEAPAVQEQPPVPGRRRWPLRQQPLGTPRRGLLSLLLGSGTGSHRGSP